MSSVHHHTLDVRHTIEHHHILFLLLALLLVAAVVVLLVPASGSIRLTPSAPAANLAAAEQARVDFRRGEWSIASVPAVSAAAAAEPARLDFRRGESGLSPAYPP
jgi:hypothetical protein